MVVLGLGKNLLFKSVLAHCEILPLSRKLFTEKGVKFKFSAQGQDLAPFLAMGLNSKYVPSEIKLPFKRIALNKLSDEINLYLKAVAVFRILQLLSKNGLFLQITCFVQFFLNGSLKLFPVPMRN